jgi:nucleotide-binding universal stress UspA family protein
MIEIRRILCPTDLSDIAPRALANALALARFHGAAIELFNPIDIALFGSTTHHVVRGARCPVLVVHTD